MSLVLYTYKQCGTCRKAVQWLRAQGLEFDERPIRETPPTKDELRRMLGYLDGDLRRLCNTSGRDYRDMGMKDRLPGMTEKELIALLSEHGNLVKRPFLLTDNGGTVGFKEEEWGALFETGT